MPYITQNTLHSCGHTHPRVVTKWSGREGRFVPIRDIRHLSPPKILLDKFEQEVQDRSSKEHAFWAKHLCRPCRYPPFSQIDIEEAN